MSEFFVVPDPEQFAAFAALPADAPFQMLNLVRFREHAEYPPDDPCTLEARSGQEAYTKSLNK